MVNGRCFRGDESNELFTMTARKSRQRYQASSQVKATLPAPGSAPPQNRAASSARAPAKFG